MPINLSLEDCTNRFAIPFAVYQRQSGFRITIFDNRTRGDNSKPRLERVVVAGRMTRVLSEGAVQSSNVSCPLLVDSYLLRRLTGRDYPGQ
jgi:hypothetical protein